MKYYAVAEGNVTNPHWVPEYLAKVNAIVEMYGGKYLARTSQIKMVEGDTDIHQTSVILEFPSKEAGDSFYTSREHRPFREARKGGFTGKFYFVAGEDAVTGE